jgi:hypothetical protein
VKIKPQAIFSLCALIFFIVFVYQAQEWRLQARLYPYAIGIPMVILAIAQVILDLRGFKAKQPSDGAPTPMDFQFTKGIDPLDLGFLHRRLVAGVLYNHPPPRLFLPEDPVGRKVGDLPVPHSRSVAGILRTFRTAPYSAVSGRANLHLDRSVMRKQNEVGSS